MCYSNLGKTFISRYILHQYDALVPLLCLYVETRSIEDF
jgi:hypothetical protein